MLSNPTEFGKSQIPYPTQQNLVNRKCRIACVLYAVLIYPAFSLSPCAVIAVLLKRNDQTARRATLYGVPGTEYDMVYSIMMHTV